MIVGLVGSARRGAVLLGMLCVAGLVASCTSKISGQAVFPEGAEPVRSAPQPCDLIPKEWLPALELTEGVPQKGNPGRMLPDGCLFSASDSNISFGGVSVYVGTDIKPEDYASDLSELEETTYGGLTWKISKGAGGIEGDCGLLTVLDETSFVQVSSANYTDSDKACDFAEQAAPVVASQLPGGTPADPPKPEDNPLTGVDACDLIKPEQAEKHGLKTPGTKSTATDSQSNICSWASARPKDRGDEVLVKIVTTTSLSRLFGPDPDRRFKLGGRTWLVYDAPSGSYGSCYVGTDITKNSYVTLFSTNRVHKKRACAQAKELAPVVNGNLPKG